MFDEMTIIKTLYALKYIKTYFILFVCSNDLFKKYKNLFKKLELLEYYKLIISLTRYIVHSN